MWMGTEMAFGDYLKKRRESIDWSQVKLAKRSGVSRNYIWMIENNKNPKNGEPPNVSVRKIRELLGALRAGGASVSETEAFLAAGKTILDPLDLKDADMPPSNSNFSQQHPITKEFLPEGKFIPFEGDYPPDYPKGILAWRVASNDSLTDKQKLDQPCEVLYQGERHFWIFKGGPVSDSNKVNAYYFQDHDHYFSVPANDVQILHHYYGTLHLPGGSVGPGGPTGGN